MKIKKSRKNEKFQRMRNDWNAWKKSNFCGQDKRVDAWIKLTTIKIEQGSGGFRESVGLKENKSTYSTYGLWKQNN